MAETDEQAERFRAEGRSHVVRLKMPREGKCVFNDAIRGPVEFDWDKEQDHVVQRADGTCLYHLASVVDDFDFQISHVIRAVEHLSNTPRQIFIAQSLGYPLPEYAHLPYVAEPGSPQKLSKRKIAQYLKNAEFNRAYDHGADIAARIVKYLMLLGWSLDDKTEDFSREEMVKCFTRQRVTKSPASFDCKKLWAFQDRYMQRLPLKQKVAKMLPYLQQAGLITDPAPCEVGPKLTRIVEASGDRLKTAGDILAYADFFFVPDEKLAYDEKDFQKRVAPPQAKDLLTKFRAVLAGIEPFEVGPLEEALKKFVEEQGIKIGDIVHALRIAVTGKSVGPGVYDCLAILGRESSLARIERALRE